MAAHARTSGNSIIAMSHKITHWNLQWDIYVNKTMTKMIFLTDYISPTPEYLKNVLMF